MSRPNILLIMCDDLGFGDVGFNGATHIQTPHLDRLAARSTRFERFYAGGPVCSPTRATCLTGRHYIRYGINHANQGRLPFEERTIGRVCKQHGYATGHFGKWHLGTLSKSGNDGNRGGLDPRLYSPPWLHGFDTCFSTESKVPTWDPIKVPDEKRPDGSQRWGIPGDDYRTAYWNDQGEEVTENLEGCDSRIIVDRVEPFIRNAIAADQPFLGVVWFHAPHTPVVAGPEWLSLYSHVEEEEERHYRGCVSAMDNQVGRLIDLMDELNAMENTLIWFCSDNGPEGGLDLANNGRSRGSTGGLRGRKRSLYEGGIGVPALIHLPQASSCPKEVTEPCSTLDILPTCAAAMGIELPDDRPIDGANVLPCLQGSTLQRAQPIPYRFLETEAGMFGSPTFALMEGRWKFLSNLDESGRWDELYDVDEDREETTNRIHEYPKLQKHYRGVLESFLKSARASYHGDDYGYEIDMISPFQEERSWKPSPEK